jgi:RNA polymerase sigma-70 factor (ECF subfamily)
MATSGQLDGFNDLLRAYYHRLADFACGLLSDEQQAHEVVQEVLVAAWRTAQQRKAPFAPAIDEAGAHRWLFQVAYRRAISRRRHETVLAFESLDVLDDITMAERLSPLAFEDQVIEGQVLASALACLSPLDVACILLHAVHGFSAREIATIIGVSPEAAKKRVWRAVERLRVAYFAPERVTSSIRGRP